MKTAYYIRVSTDQQDTDSQLQAITKYTYDCNMDKSNLCCYMDESASGSTMDRPAVQQLLKDIRAGKISKLIVYELSRLSRDMLTTGLLMQELCQYNVELHVVADGGIQNNDGAINQFIAITKGLTAQVERERIVERTKAGLKATKARGTKLGPPKGNSNRRGKKKPIDQTLMQKVCQLRRTGLSIHDIALMLDSNYSRIQRILKVAKV